MVTFLVYLVGAICLFVDVFVCENYSLFAAFATYTILYFIFLVGWYVKNYNKNYKKDQSRWKPENMLFPTFHEAIIQSSERLEGLGVRSSDVPDLPDDEEEE